MKGGVWSLDGKVELIDEMKVCLEQDNDDPTAAGEADSSTPAATDKASNGVSNGRKTITIVEESLSTPKTSCGTAEDAITTLKEEKEISQLSSIVTTNNNKRLIEEEEPLTEPSSSSSARKKFRFTEPGETLDINTRQFTGVCPPASLCSKAALAQQLGRDMAQRLLQRGADKVLQEAKQQNKVEAPNTRPVKEKDVELTADAAATATVS